MLLFLIAAAVVDAYDDDGFTLHSLLLQATPTTNLELPTMVGITGDSTLPNDRAPSVTAPGIVPPDNLFNNDDLDWSDNEKSSAVLTCMKGMPSLEQVEIEVTNSPSATKVDELE